MKKNRIFLPIALILLALVIWVLWANTAVELNTVTVAGEYLPAGFDGFRIAHVSDLHSSDVADQVVTLLQSARPDIICITGDLMDMRDTDTAVALDFAEKAVAIAPCYYITGNHEARLPSVLYSAFLDGLVQAGVTVLDDEEVILEQNGEQISIVGHFWGNTEEIVSISNFDGYRILLSHQPEDFENYVEGGYDLVLSGHAHGGQFRIPFVGDLYAPGQGFFPQYAEGVHMKDCTTMVVSRGIGNSTIPVRINNRPEVILVVLECLTA